MTHKVKADAEEKAPKDAAKLTRKRRLGEALRKNLAKRKPTGSAMKSPAEED